MKEPDASRELGDDSAAERRLLGGFDEVDLDQTGQIGLSGEVPRLDATARYRSGDAPSPSSSIASRAARA